MTLIFSNLIVYILIFITDQDYNYPAMNPYPPEPPQSPDSSNIPFIDSDNSGSGSESPENPSPPQQPIQQGNSVQQQHQMAAAPGQHHQQVPAVPGQHDQQFNIIVQQLSAMVIGNPAAMTNGIGSVIAGVNLDLMVPIMEGLRNRIQKMLDDPVGNYTQTQRENLQWSLQNINNMLNMVC